MSPFLAISIGVVAVIGIVALLSQQPRQFTHLWRTFSMNIR
ncbi:hypothetical protein OAL27_01870 [Verrucomicrobiales bacterium]|jgi:hypothetical protein|nr:hypothetical protein [bacterium]MDC0312678.1 hypothetical protein [Verrucomicrobiales bacterium]